MRNRLASYRLEVTEALQDAPAPVVGRSRCRSSMVLRNPGDERVVVRTASVRDLDGMRGAAGESFTVRIPGVVRPSSTARVPISFDIPPTTPPGTYRFEVVVGDLTQAMTVEVSPTPSIRLRPPVVVVTGPGRSVHQLVVQNTGNVDVSVSGTVAVPLEDELLLCRSLRAALALFDEHDEAEVSADRLVVRAACRAHEALAAAVLGVRFEPEADPIAPGASTRVAVHIDTPKSLDPRTRYGAAIPVLTATLGVVVVSSKVGSVAPTAGASTPKRAAPAKPTRTRRKT